MGGAGGSGSECRTTSSGLSSARAIRATNTSMSASEWRGSQPGRGAGLVVVGVIDQGAAGETTGSTPGSVTGFPVAVVTLPSAGRGRCLGRHGEAARAVAVAHHSLLDGTGRHLRLRGEPERDTDIGVHRQRHRQPHRLPSLRRGVPDLCRAEEQASERIDAVEPLPQGRVAVHDLLHGQSSLLGVAASANTRRRAASTTSPDTDPARASVSGSARPAASSSVLMEAPTLPAICGRAALVAWAASTARRSIVHPDRGSERVTNVHTASATRAGRVALMSLWMFSIHRLISRICSGVVTSSSWTLGVVGLTLEAGTPRSAMARWWMAGTCRIFALPGQTFPNWRE